MKKDYIDDILSGVPLVQYAINFGYEKITKGTLNSAWLTLKNTNTGDSIRVKQNQYPPLFTNNDEGLSKDRGNVINFLINRLDGGIIQPDNKPSKEKFSNAISVLKKEIGVLEPVNYTVSKNKSKSALSPEEVIKEIKNLENLTDVGINYLERNRKLSSKTLNNPLFKGLIKEVNKTITGQNEDAFNIRNIAFVKRDIKNEIKGFEKHYYSKKEDKQIKSITELNKPGLHRSNIIPGAKNLIIGEAIIDCLSHFELTKAKDSAYISTQGNINPKDFDDVFEVYNALNKNNNATITTITDNDRQGYLYDLNFAIMFYNKDKEEAMNITKIQSSEALTLVFPKNFKNDFFKEVNDKMNRFLNLENDWYKNVISKEHEPLKTSFEVKENQTHLHLPLSQKKKQIFKFIKDVTKAIYEKNNMKFYVHKSKKHDWNEDLKEKKSNVISTHLTKGYKR